MLLLKGVEEYRPYQEIQTGIWQIHQEYVHKQIAKKEDAPSNIPNDNRC